MAKSKLTKEQLESLAGLDDGMKADLVALFSDAEEANRNVEELRKKVPSDSQRVVENSEYKKLEKGLRERDEKITTLNTKLGELDLAQRQAGPVGSDEFDPLSIFRPIFDLIGNDE